MKLYLLSQSVQNGYDTYDSCVVVADDENEARQIHPDGGTIVTRIDGTQRSWNYDWAEKIEDVEVIYLGEYVAGEYDSDFPIICASFNAG